MRTRSQPCRPRVIALWAVPRSVSTAFERTFAQRADTQVVHEPFTDCYYFSGGRRSSRYGDRPERAGHDGSAAIAEILSVTAPVAFVKDLCFQAEPYVSDDFLRRCVNTFIVRDPPAVLRSLSPLKPDFTADEFGFRAFGRMWQRVVHDLAQEPIVVDGDEFRARPRRVLRDYCHRVGLAFEESMLHWRSGTIREWGPHEQDSQAKWHRTLEHSTGILPPTTEPPATSCEHACMVQEAWRVMGGTVGTARRPARSPHPSSARESCDGEPRVRGG